MTLVSCTLPKTKNVKHSSYTDVIIKAFLKMDTDCAEITECDKRASALKGAIDRYAKKTNKPVKGAIRAGKAYIIRTTKVATV